MKRSLLAAAALLTATPVLAAASDPGAGSTLAIWAVFLTCYFFPSIIAAFRSHHNTLAIFLLNLFLGWTVIGWLGSLIWAATAVVRRNADGQIG
jgi:hypothetical protein